MSAWERRGRRSHCVGDGSRKKVIDNTWVQELSGTWGGCPDLEDDNANGEEEDVLLKRQAKGYARNSTIHGLAYIAEDARPISEKYF